MVYFSQLLFKKFSQLEHLKQTFLFIGCPHLKASLKYPFLALSLSDHVHRKCKQTERLSVIYLCANMLCSSACE